MSFITGSGGGGGSSLTLPGSSTDDALVRWDGTGGNAVSSQAFWTLTDAGALTGATNAVVLFDDGAVGTPGIAVNGDTNTGIYGIASDTLGITAGGTEMLRAYTRGGLSSVTVGYEAANGGAYYLTPHANSAYIQAAGSGLGMNLTCPGVSGRVAFTCGGNLKLEVYSDFFYVYCPTFFFNNAAPASAPDIVKIDGYDVGGAAGRRSLAVATEEAVVAESVTSDATLAITINGTTYKLLLKT